MDGTATAERLTFRGVVEMTATITMPGRILRFLEHHANIAFAGTRSRELVPCGHRVSGWFVDAGGRTLTALIAEHFTTNLVESLRDNGELAVTVEEFPTHETYQFKGRYLRHRSVVPEDIAVVDRIRDRFLKGLRHVYSDAPELLLDAYFQAPALAVEFEVCEIFVQTPGPGAGARLVPPAERTNV
jgi:hypothetical protein